LGREGIPRRNLALITINLIKILRDAVNHIRGEIMCVGRTTAGYFNPIGNWFMVRP
jgi:hypothetical protein